jgi:tripartite-type tricarboxylate transporter receptor subunit TctC
MVGMSLAVTSTQRAATASDIPTNAEVALPGVDAATWFALVAPAGTPRAIVERLNAEVTRFAQEKDVEKRFADLGMTIGTSTPAELDAYVKSEIAKWAQVIKDADIRAPE